MKIRSQSAGQSQSASRTDGSSAEAKAADAQVRGQKLLALAAERSLVSPQLLGVSQASLDTLAVGLLEGALLLAQRAGEAAKGGPEQSPDKGPDQSPDKGGAGE